MAVAAGGCARSIEEAWAFEMNWRNQRGGPTAQEVARVAALPRTGKGKLAKREDPWKEMLDLLHAVRLEPAHKRRPPKTLTGAVLSGDHKLVEQFFAAGFNPNEKTVGFSSALNPATSRGDLAMVELLLAHGARPGRGKDNAFTPFTPLNNTAEHGHLAVVKRLVEAGVSLEEEGPDALVVAAREGRTEIVRYFMEKRVPAGAKDGAAVTAAAAKGQLEMLRLLFDAGVTAAQAGKALQWAAYGGQFAAARYLVEAGVSPADHPHYATDMFGRKCRKLELPSKVAREQGYKLLADYLSGKAADETKALAATPQDNRKDAGERLVSALRDLDELENGKRLEGVYRQGAVLRILEIIRSGAVTDRLNERDKKRGFPLTLAAQNGDLEVVEALLANGANANPPIKSGPTPLHAAAENGHRAIVRCLIAGGAGVNVAGSTGRIPLMSAVEWGDPEIVRSMLEAGADPTVKDKNGQTVLAIDAGLHDKAIKAALKAAMEKTRTGKSREVGEGTLCRRRKKMIDVAAARGVQDFMDFFGQPEWAVAAVRAPAEAVAKEYAAIVKSPRWEPNVARKRVDTAKRFAYVLQLKGSSWSLVLRSLGWVEMEDLVGMPREAQELSARLKTRVYSYLAEDTSSASGYEMFENGQSLEKAEWGDDYHFESKLRRAKPKSQRQFPDPVFADEGIYLPPCWFESDGEVAKLGLEGISPDAVERVDFIEMPP